MRCSPPPSPSLLPPRTTSHPSRASLLSVLSIQTNKRTEKEAENIPQIALARYSIHITIYRQPYITIFIRSCNKSGKKNIEPRFRFIFTHSMPFTIENFLNCRNAVGFCWLLLSLLLAAAFRRFCCLAANRLQFLMFPFAFFRSCAK